MPEDVLMSGQKTKSNDNEPVSIEMKTMEEEINNDISNVSDNGAMERVLNCESGNRILTGASEIDKTMQESRVRIRKT